MGYNLKSIKSVWIPICTVMIFAISSFFFHGGESFNWLRLWEFFLLSSIMVLLMIKFRKGEISVNQNGYTYLLLAFILAVTISTLFSYYVWGSISDLLEISSYALLFSLLFSFKKEETEIPFIAIFILLGFIDSLWVIFQHYAMHYPRPAGFLKYANWNAQFILYSTIISIHTLKLLFEHRDRKFYIFVVVLLVSIFAMILSASRMLFVLVPIGLFLLGILFNKTKITLIITAIVILLLLTIPNPVSRRILHNKNKYDMQRPGIWKMAYKVGMIRPLIGVGEGAFEDFAIMKNFPVNGEKWRYGVHARIAHNQYLQFFANYGILGFLPYFALLLVIGIYALKEIYRRKYFSRSLWAIIFILFATHSFFDNPLYLPINAIFISTAAAFVLPVFSIKRYRIDRKHIVSYNLFFMLLIILTAFVTLHPFVSQYFAKKADKESKINLEKANKLYLAAYSFSPLDPQYAALYAKYWIIRYQKSKDMTDIYPMFSYMNIALRLAPTKNFYRDLFIDYLTVGKVNLRNFDEIVEKLLENDIHYDPYNPDYRLQYAKLIYSANPDSAKKVIEKGIEYEPNFEAGKEFLKKYYRYNK